MSELKALIFSIQRFSLHDGPGIRTTFFLKGCPLRCFWCANPESWNGYAELMTHDRKCIKSGHCRDACTRGAITITPSRRIINRSKCDRCMACAAVCPSKALEVVGEQISVEDAIDHATADSLFQQHSGGGVTLSGGEPLLQSDFVREFGGLCRERGIHVALDTCGYAPAEALETVLPSVDLVMIDLKHTDPDQHRLGTGKDNALIIANVRRAATKVETWLRVPLIPEFNDSPENLAEAARIAKEAGCTKVSILPYHELWRPKFGQLGWRLRRKLPIPPSDEATATAKSIVEAFGLTVEVGR